jgi:hypothetical protein
MEDDMPANLSRLGLTALLLLTVQLVWSEPSRLTDEYVAELQDQCEARRSEELAPIRAQKTQACIEQQLKTPDHCKRYYRTYGNTTAGPGGGMYQGYFYDLPECQRWIEAREQLHQSRSRP